MIDPAVQQERRTQHLKRFKIERRSAFRWVLVLFVAITLCLSVEKSFAQDNAAADAPAAAAAPNAAAPAAAPTTSNADKSYLQWTFESLGWTYSIVFLFMSFTFVAYAVMNFLMTRRESVCPLALVETFETHLNAEEYQQAYELARTDESFLGQVLAAGLAKLSTGTFPQAVEAMQEVGEEENMKMEHRLSYLAMIGTLAPMVGLLGTVDGMIASFNVIANHNTTPKPSELASGISTALFTTLVGLLIAIPAILIYNLLRNRMARLVLEVGIVSSNLMGRFEQKKK